MTTQPQALSLKDLIFAGAGAVAGVLSIVAVSRLADLPPGLYDSALTVVGQAVSAMTTAAGTTLAREAHVMSLPLTAHSQAYWFAARAGGIVAYLLLWFATFWGIMVSSKMLKGRVEASLIYGLHEFFPLLAILFAAIHAVVLLGDSYIDFRVSHLFLPFTSPYKPLWTGLGTVALYLTLALVTSFYVRSWIGRKVWRALHYTSFLAFGLALLHGLMAGTDSKVPGMQWMYIATGASILFATYYRVLSVQPKPVRTASRLAKDALRARSN
jgi:hypothetical protein